MHVALIQNSGSGDLVYLSRTEWPNANNLVHNDFGYKIHITHLLALIHTIIRSLYGQSGNTLTEIWIWNEKGKALVDGFVQANNTIDDYNNAINYVTSPWNIDCTHNVNRKNE